MDRIVDLAGRLAVANVEHTHALVQKLIVKSVQGLHARGHKDVVRRHGLPASARLDHDALIAYTSQVMHIIAVAVCDDPDLFACKGFEGSSFRGCTRVAALDVGLWTQLFSLNQPALLAVLDRLIGNLQSYREVLATGDRKALGDKLAFSAARKRQMDLPGPDLLE